VDRITIQSHASARYLEERDIEIAGPLVTPNAPMKLPQLSLRELFLLVVIVALGCGWWVDREKLKSFHKSEMERVSQVFDDTCTRFKKEMEDLMKLVPGGGSPRI